MRKNAETEANKGGLSARVKEPEEYCQELADLAKVQAEELSAINEELKRHAEEDLDETVAYL